MVFIIALEKYRRNPTFPLKKKNAYIGIPPTLPSLLISFCLGLFPACISPCSQSMRRSQNKHDLKQRRKIFHIHFLPYNTTDYNFVKTVLEIQSISKNNVLKKYASLWLYKNTGVH